MQKNAQYTQNAQNAQHTQNAWNAKYVQVQKMQRY